MGWLIRSANPRALAIHVSQQQRIQEPFNLAWITLCPFRQHGCDLLCEDERSVQFGAPFLVHRLNIGLQQPPCRATVYSIRPSPFPVAIRIPRDLRQPGLCTSRSVTYARVSCAPSEGIRNGTWISFFEVVTGVGKWSGRDEKIREVAAARRTRSLPHRHR